MTAGTIGARRMTSTNRSELRALVIARDGGCILALLYPRFHQCRDRWGEPHLPDDLRKLTLEHVREHPGGMRRDDPGWCVAMCATANTEHAGSTTEPRRLINAYLAGVRAGGGV